MTQRTVHLSDLAHLLAHVRHILDMAPASRRSVSQTAPTRSDFAIATTKSRVEHSRPRECGDSGLPGAAQGHEDAGGERAICGKTRKNRVRPSVVNFAYFDRDVRCEDKM